MLQKELSYKNMAVLSASSRGARGMFNTNAYISHMASLQARLEEYFKLERDVMELEQKISREFFGTIPPSLNRLYNATKDQILSKNKKLVFTITLVILAILETYPWFREIWQNAENISLQRVFHEMGLDHVFEGSQISRYLTTKRMYKFVRPVVKYLEKNKLKTDIYISLDGAIEYTKGKIVRPLADWMDAKDALAKKYQEVSRLVQKTGDERIIREFNML